MISWDNLIWWCKKIFKFLIQEDQVKIIQFKNKHEWLIVLEMDQVQNNGSEMDQISLATGHDMTTLDNCSRT